jgi:hypothetical protein
MTSRPFPYSWPQCAIMLPSVGGRLPRKSRMLVRAQLRGPSEWSCSRRRGDENSIGLLCGGSTVGKVAARPHGACDTGRRLCLLERGAGPDHSQRPGLGKDACRLRCVRTRYSQRPSESRHPSRARKGGHMGGPREPPSMIFIGRDGLEKHRLSWRGRRDLPGVK